MLVLHGILKKYTESVGFLNRGKFFRGWHETGRCVVFCRWQGTCIETMPDGEGLCCRCQDKMRAMRCIYCAPTEVRWILLVQGNSRYVLYTACRATSLLLLTAFCQPGRVHTQLPAEALGRSCLARGLLKPWQRCIAPETVSLMRQNQHLQFYLRRGYYEPDRL